jgi:hypothetical protein
LGLDHWLHSNQSVFYWIDGTEGTGKTTIAYTFSKKLDLQNILVASFFCMSTSADCRDATRIIPTIAYQLADYSTPFQSALYEVLESNQGMGPTNLFMQFEQLLVGPLNKIRDLVPENLLVVIEAIDECDSQSQVGDLLDILFQHASALPLRFLVTSRPEPSIYTHMMLDIRSHTMVHLHKIEASRVREDISIYFQRKLASMSLSPAQFNHLVDRSDSSFSRAATLVHYIQPEDHRSDPHIRLREALEMKPDAIRKCLRTDALCKTVLKSTLRKEEPAEEDTDDIRRVLRTVLSIQEPITVETVAKLAGIDDPERTRSALYSLRSILHYSEEAELVSLLSGSLPGIMFDEQPGVDHHNRFSDDELLAERCFLLMDSQLRFNICKLESSFMSDEEIDTLQERIGQHISPPLSYACRFWASHIALAPHSNTLESLLRTFICDKLLFWMEVLNLRQEIAIGADMLLMAQEWLKVSRP